VRDIYCAIGQLLCDLEPKQRPYVLTRLAAVLKAKCELDDVAKARIAYCEAQAEYFPADIKPTFAEVEKKFQGQLDRRLLKEAGCSVRKCKRKMPRPRKRNRGKTGRAH
jgi:hypothetical protein